MGYRNDIALQIKKEDYDGLLQYLKQLPQEDEKVSKEHAEHCIEFTKNAVKNICQHEGIEWFVLYWDWVKFDEYDEYNEFHYIYNYIADEASAYQFIRVGEDYDDIQEEYYLGPYDTSYIGIKREICFDGLTNTNAKGVE